MNNNKLWTSVYIVLEWIMNIAYLHILWVLFTLTGLVIFGWMPATISIYATWRKILRSKEKEVPIFKTFFQEYKQAFIQKNMAGFLIVLGGLLIYFYFQFIQHTGGFIHYFYTGFIYIICFFYFNLLIYLPPVIVHFELGFLQYFKQAFLISISSLVTTIFFYIGIILMIGIWYLQPSLFIPFGFSALSLFIMKGCLYLFKKLGF